MCGNTFSDDTEVCRSQNSRKADYRNDEIKIRQSEWVSKMKQFIFFIAIFLHASFLISCSYDSPVSYDCDGTGVIYSLKELKIDKHTVPFKITHEGNTLILEMRNKQYQLSFKERYMGKSGYEHYVFRNNLLEVITAENGTSVFTLSTHTKDQTITFGKCK